MVVQGAPGGRHPGIAARTQRRRPAGSRLIADARNSNGLARAALRWAGRDSPNGVADVVGNDECAGPVDRHADRATAGFAVLDEAGDEIHRLANRAPILEPDERDLVSVQLRP